MTSNIKILMLLVIAFVLTTDQKTKAAEAPVLPDYIDVKILSGHTKCVNSTSTSVDGQLIVTASDDGTAKIWDTNTGKCLLIIDNHTEIFLSAKFSPDRKKIITISKNATVKIWDIDTGVCKNIREFPGEIIRYAFFSPDGKFFITGHNHIVKIWSVNEEIYLYNSEKSIYEPRTVDFSPDGSKVVTTSDDTTANIWDAQSGNCIHTLTGHERLVDSAKFSPDGKLIVTASIGGIAKVWNANTGKCLKIIKTYYGMNCCYHAKFSPDGSKIVTTAYYENFTYDYWETTEVLDLETLECLYTREGQNSSFIVFSPNGSKILTLSNKNTATLTKLLEFSYPCCIKSALFNQDGSKIIITLEDNTVRVYTDKRHSIQRQLLAQTLALGLHKRLGEVSPLNILPQCTISNICRLSVELDYFVLI